MTRLDEKDGTRQNRRGTFFKQFIEELNVTQTEFTNQINKLIVRQEFYLPDSKKISDWKSSGIPGPGTSMKARIRQLAVIQVLGIERNSDHHKMLDGRLSIPQGVLDTDQPTQIHVQKIETDQPALAVGNSEIFNDNDWEPHSEQLTNSDSEKSDGSWLRSLTGWRLEKLGLSLLLVVFVIGFAAVSGFQLLGWNDGFATTEKSMSLDEATAGNNVNDEVAVSLIGPVGRYRVQGANPGGNANYDGTVTVERSGQTFIVLWNIAGREFTGIGTANIGDATIASASTISAIAIAFTANDSLGVAYLALQADGSWKGTWTGWGVVGFGTEVWTPM